MTSERRGKGTRAPPRSRMPAPPRRRGRGGVGLAEGVRCGGRVASVVLTGRGHWSAEVVLWVPAAPRRCRGSPPPRRLAIARNLSLTAALKFVVKPVPTSKAGWSAAGECAALFYHPHAELAARSGAHSPARHSAAQRRACRCKSASRNQRAHSPFCAPLYSTAAGQATLWAKGSAPPQAGRARTAMS